MEELRRRQATQEIVADPAPVGPAKPSDDSMDVDALYPYPNVDELEAGADSLPANVYGSFLQPGDEPHDALTLQPSLLNVPEPKATSSKGNSPNVRPGRQDTKIIVSEAPRAEQAVDIEDPFNPAANPPPQPLVRFLGCRFQIRSVLVD